MKTLEITGFSLFLAGVLAFAGCKSDSTSPIVLTPPVVPNAGSYFITVSTTTDSTGFVISSDTTKSVILQTNVSIYGKTGVIVRLDSDANGWSNDTGYGYYEANGDVSSYSSASGNNASLIPTGWVTSPVASQTSIQWFNIVGSFNPNTDSHLIAIVSGSGIGSMTIKGQSFQTENLTLTIQSTDTTLSTGTTYTVNSIITSSFAPALGCTVDENQPGIREYEGAPLDNSTHTKLIDFLLK